uniref:TauD/TfdA family dioxygenase n=1 Tax=Phenylobacterium glaciei TaxID=2803784 RepID=A0A974SAJ6_9CAUL|nr:TauD/TfdA family dioxygenase [Phenylobacterium glaciei]
MSGVDLSQNLEDVTVAEIRAAFVEHQVIFFRDQTLTPDQQLAFGRRFGPLNIHPYVAGMADHPEVMEVIKEPADRVNFGGGWHSDMSFLEHPSIASILYAVQLPDYGGDTLFASQAAAYEALTPGLRATLETLNAVHSAGREYSSSGHSAQKRSSMNVAEAEGATGEFIHPVVLTHPETGRKALYVNPAFTMKIEGWSTRESSRCSTSCSSTAGASGSRRGSSGRRARWPLGQPLGLALCPQRLSRAAPHAPGDRRRRSRALRGRDASGARLVRLIRTSPRTSLPGCNCHSERRAT